MTDRVIYNSPAQNGYEIVTHETYWLGQDIADNGQMQPAGFLWQLLPNSKPRYRVKAGGKLNDR